MKSCVLTAALLMAVSIFALQAHADTKEDKFVEKAAIAGKFEIESSQLALERSTNADVKAFAQQMIDDHTKADAELKATVAKANLASTVVPSTLDEKHQKIIDKLKKADAKDFDKDYLKAQENAHEDAVDLFEDYAKEGDNADLKAFAAKTLPTLKAHDEKVDNLEKIEKHAEK